MSPGGGRERPPGLVHESSTNSSITSSPKIGDASAAKNKVSPEPSTLEHQTPIYLPRTEGEVPSMPFDLTLLQWTVRPGSFVRKGDLLAFYRNEPPESTPDAIVLPATSTAYKRPSKRKRPGSFMVETPKNGPITASNNDSSPPTTNTDSTSTGRSVRAAKSGIVHIDTSTTGPSVDNADRIVLGYLTDCEHPTIVGSLCAICGQQVLRPSERASDTTPPSERSSSEADDTVEATQGNLHSNLTVSGGLTLSISEKEGKRMADLDRQRLWKQNRLALVLDLDHTLLHATNDIRAHSLWVAQQQRSNQKMEIRTLMLSHLVAPAVQNMHHARSIHYVKLRPHLKDFLTTMHSQYEISFYTAGTRDYAEEITKLLARQIVGANHDQLDYENLVYKLEMAKQEYEKASSEVHSGNETKGETPNNPAAATQSADVDSNETHVPPTSPSKKRTVTFGGIPEQKSLADLKDEVTRLKKEMNEAERMEKLALEAKKRYFGTRIVSRTDVADLGTDVKSLKRVFPCGGTMAVVLDDREDVWANAKDIHGAVRKGEPPENLLVVNAYHWPPFHGFADVNNASGTDIAQELQSDLQIESDEQLRWMMNILQRVHKAYYSLSDDERRTKTVADIIRTIRASTLYGAEIVLSGLVPLHKQSESDPNKARPLFVRYAESLGARVVPNVGSLTTHVVAMKYGTDKTLAARKIKGCFVVKPSWLISCLHSFTRRDESLYIFDESKRRYAGSGPSSSSPPRQISKESETEEEDDDFAAAFEDEMMNEL